MADEFEKLFRPEPILVSILELHRVAREALVSLEQSDRVLRGALAADSKAEVWGTINGLKAAVSESELKDDRVLKAIVEKIFEYATFMTTRDSKDGNGDRNGYAAIERAFAAIFACVAQIPPYLRNVESMLSIYDTCERLTPIPAKGKGKK